MGITLKEFKEYINSLPSELDSLEVVYSEVGDLNKEDNTWFRKDIPIESIAVDGNSGELILASRDTIETIDRFMNINND